MTRDDLWLTFLRDAVSISSRKEVAQKLKVSRPTVHLAMAEKYPARTDHLKVRVIQAFGQVHCPHTAETVTISVCAALLNRRPPTNNPLAMSHWRACQSCSNRPVRQGEYGNDTECSSSDKATD